jgi:hypothetical protein
MVFEAPTKRVFLLDVADAQGRVTYRARPAYAGVVPGQKVRFANFARATIELSFEPGLFDRDAVTIEHDGYQDLEVRREKPGRSPYKGRVIKGAPSQDEATRDQLQGESSPEIIIDRGRGG